MATPQSAHHQPGSQPASQLGGQPSPNATDRAQAQPTGQPTRRPASSRIPNPAPSPTPQPEHRGLFVATDTPPENALVRGLLAGSAFTTAMLLISTLMGIAALGMTEGLAISLTCIVAGLLGGLLQQVWFNPRVLGLRLPYAARVPLFGITYLLVLAACAYLGRWLPPTPAAWGTFVVIYLAILVVLTGVFTHRYRRQTALYADHLAAYRRQQGR